MSIFNKKETLLDALKELSGLEKAPWQLREIGREGIPAIITKLEEKVSALVYQLEHVSEHESDFHSVQPNALGQKILIELKAIEGLVQTQINELRKVESEISNIPINQLNAILGAREGAVSELSNRILALIQHLESELNNSEQVKAKFTFSLTNFYLNWQEAKASGVDFSKVGTVKDILQARISNFNLIREGVTVKEMIAYSPDGIHIKITKDMTQFNGVFEDCDYANVKGEEFDRSELILDKVLTKSQFLSHPIWNYLVDNNKQLLEQYWSCLGCLQGLGLSLTNLSLTNDKVWSLLYINGGNNDSSLNVSYYGRSFVRFLYILSNPLLN